MRKIVPYRTSRKRKTHLGINLTEHVKDLCNANYRILKKKQDSGKTSNVHESSNLMVFKLLQKLSTESMQSLPQFQ